MCHMSLQIPSSPLLKNPRLAPTDNSFSGRHIYLPSLPSSIPYKQIERGQKILLLETGEDEHLNPLTRWGYFFPSGAYSHLYHNYFTEPEPHVNNRRLYHQAAKALGGGTAVNAMGRPKRKEGRE